MMQVATEATGARDDRRDPDGSGSAGPVTMMPGVARDPRRIIDGSAIVGEVVAIASREAAGVALAGGVARGDDGFMSDEPAATGLAQMRSPTRGALR
jgi:hypothetical protein